MVEDASSCVIWDIEGSEECLNFTAGDKAILLSIQAPEAFPWILEALLELLAHEIADFLQFSVQRRAARNRGTAIAPRSSPTSTLIRVVQVSKKK